MDVNAEITQQRIQPAPKNLYVGAMLILAIDTALDACAAAVLDTSASDVIAQESQSMKRADAADRACDESIGRCIRRTRPHRGNRRSRQLYRIAGRPFGGARHRAGRR